MGGDILTGQRGILSDDKIRVGAKSVMIKTDTAWIYGGTRAKLTIRPDRVALLSLSGVINEAIIEKIREEVIVQSRIFRTPGWIVDMRFVVNVIRFRNAKILPAPWQPDLGRMPLALVARAEDLAMASDWQDQMASAGLLRGLFTNHEDALFWVLSLIDPRTA